MCGICGVLGRRDPDTVRSMLSRLRHRGPDDEHAVAGDDFAVGARRLAILDVEGGRQPVADESDTVWAVHNGELYDLPTLRTGLLSRGHRLRSRCDSELLPHLYEEHGARLPERVDGMFAFALWDARERVGLLARDRMGKKPLYYTLVDGALYFASEIKCLLHVPGLERRLDPESLHHYLSLKHVPCPRTIFEGIRQLPPAHRLVYRPGRAPVIERYWSPPRAIDTGLGSLPEEEIVDRLLETLRAAVERRLLADVPIGFYLSGGIDSSLITALAAELAPEPIRTFTLTYGADSTTEGKELDRRWARHVAERHGTEHIEERVDFGDFPGSLRAILGCFDEPFAGVVSTWFLSRRMAEHVKVAVSGDGADELFGSYLSHRLAGPLARWPEYRRTGDPDLLRPCADRLDLLESLWAPEPWRWRARLAVLDERAKRDLYAPDFAKRLNGVSTTDWWATAFAAAGHDDDPLDALLAAEFETLLPDQVLAFTDRLSMAWSLEVRSPFLDTAVVDLVASLPGELKIRGDRTKYLLKRAAARYFPEEMVHRPKEGFLMPLTEWLLGDLEDYVRQTLSPSRLAAHGLFRAEAVTGLVDALYRGDSDHFDVNRVYALLVFQEWHDLYLS